MKHDAPALVPAGELPPDMVLQEEADAVAPAKKPKSLPSTSVHLLAGASAGLISSFTLQPLDLLKTRLQQQKKEVAGYRTTLLRELNKLVTVKDLWRGVLPSTLRTSVGAGLYFTILSQTRQYLDRNRQHQASATSVLPRLSPLENLATGFVVRAAVGVITMPITVVKTRYESSMYNYNSMYEGFEGIYTDGGKGSVRNFFKGTVATLARDCPYAGLYVLFYEGFKNEVVPSAVRAFRADDTVAAGLTNSISAVCAASVLTALTAPFDAVKTRLQLATLTKGPATSILAATRQLLLEPGGARNLFNGLSLRLGRKALSAGISWCIYEELLKML